MTSPTSVQTRAAGPTWPAMAEAPYTMSDLNFSVLFALRSVWSIFNAKCCARICCVMWPLPSDLAALFGADGARGDDRTDGKLLIDARSC